MTAPRLGEPLTRAQVEAICRRAFGPETGLLGLEQFRDSPAGQVYRLTVPGRLPLILRVGPPAGAGWAEHERAALRREHALRPHFAPIAHLLPETLYADFTGELLDRDYVLQTFIDGRRWDALADQLEAGDSLALWGQFGGLLRRLHDVAGDRFGGPPPAPQFAHWSDAVAHRLEAAAAGLRQAGLAAEAGTVAGVLKLAQRRRLLLDEVAAPRLLHGGLWLGGLVVRASADGPRLVGVLDTERAWWGDPLADWTLYCLAQAKDEAMAPARASFWAGYGPLPQPAGPAVRGQIYTALHAAEALLHAARHSDDALAEPSRLDLAEAAAQLRAAD